MTTQQRTLTNTPSVTNEKLFFSSFTKSNTVLVIQTTTFPVSLLPNRMDGTKTISSLLCQHLKETGSSPSRPSPPATFRCPQLTTMVGSSFPQTQQDRNRLRQWSRKTSGIYCKNVFFSLQLPVPRRLLPCWESKSIETPSEITRGHSQLCNFITNKGTTVSIKNNIQVFTHVKAI